MKVVCVKIINPTSGKEETQSRWVTLAAEYVVLSIEESGRQGATLRIVDDEGTTPGLGRAEMFRTVSDEIPSNGVARVDEAGLLISLRENG